MNQEHEQALRPAGTPAGKARLDPGLERLALEARAILLFERAWQALLPPLIVAGAFVSISWTGIWLGAPHWLRETGVLALAICFGASLWPLRRFRWPSRKEALERIDQASGLAFRPATALADRLGNGASDPVTLALWRLHRRRAAKAIPLLRTGAPSPRAADIDRYALRALVLIALIATGVVAGPQKYARLAAAFDWQFGSLRSADGRIDAWIDPPAYTGKMPAVLNLARSHDFFAIESPERIQAPIASTVVIHASGGTLDLSVKGALGETRKENGAGTKAAKRDSKGETRLLLSGDATLTLGLSGRHMGTFDIHAIPDDPPAIALIGEPKFNLRGTFELRYSVADDYGAVSAEARFANPILPGGRPAKRSLADPPRVPLMLPPPPNTKGEAKTTIDLTDHPWAGARVQMTLAARDDAGNEGTSASTSIVLPQKPMLNPLARALAEQRRALILAPEDKERVANALDALMIAPDTFGTSAGVYVGLRVALDRLTAAQTDDDLRDTAELLWQMALRIESGDLTEAERDLRAAEQELREAMQRGASGDEIRKLTENLRAAMDKFLQQLAAQQKELARQDEPALGGNSRIVRPKELQKMLDDLQAMLRSGDTAAAQRMLEQLQNIFENLRLARPRKPDPVAREVGRALDELGRLSQDQQDLRDETYQGGAGQRQQQRRGQQRYFGELPPGLTFGDIFGQQPGEGFDGDGGLGGNGQAKPEGKPGPRPDDAAGLANRQKALRGRLEDLQNRLNEAGAAAGSLDGAKDAMLDAEGALRDGSGGNNSAAVDAQGRAVEALREGAQKLAESMQGDGEGTGADGGEDGLGAAGRFGSSGGTDPLGRPAGRDNGFARYDPMGAPAAERARRVLEQLRRRLGEPGRPREELDYFERLMRRY